MNHQPSTPASGGAALAAPPEAPRSMNTSLSSTVKTADWKAEKHVPVIAAPASAKAGEPFDVEIDVGKEIPHPNTAQHHIVWIALHFVPDGSNTSIELGRADFSAHACPSPSPASSTPRPTATCTDCGPPPRRLRWRRQARPSMTAIASQRQIA